MKILVIQLRAIGDVICTLPAISKLKKALPDADIHFLVEPTSRPIVEAQPGIAKVIVYDKSRAWEEIKRVRAEKYDVIIDFMNNPRTAYIVGFSQAKWKVSYACGVRSIFYNFVVPVPVEPEYVPKRKLRLVNTWLKKIGQSVVETTDFRPKLHLTLEDEAFANAWVTREKLSDKKIIVLFPIHKHPICCWKPERFQNVARQLAADSSRRVFVAWGPGEESRVKPILTGLESVVGVLPPNDLRKIAAVLKKASLVLANNSGSMHLAVAVGTPTATIYGPTRPIDWNPIWSGESLAAKDKILMAEEVACQGCRLKICDVGHLCMELLTERKVLKACEDILSPA